MLTVVPDPSSGDGDRPATSSSSLIDDIVRDGARRVLAQALQAEVDAYISQFAAERDEHGRRLVVRNGYHDPREVLTSAGADATTDGRPVKIVSIVEEHTRECLGGGEVASSPSGIERVSRDGRNGSASFAAPAAIGLARVNSAPSSTASLEIHNHTRRSRPRQWAVLLVVRPEVGNEKANPADAVAHSTTASTPPARMTVRTPASAAMPPPTATNNGRTRRLQTDQPASVRIMSVVVMSIRCAAPGTGGVSLRSEATSLRHLHRAARCAADRGLTPTIRRWRWVTGSVSRVSRMGWPCLTSPDPSAP